MKKLYALLGLFPMLEVFLKRSLLSNERAKAFIARMKKKLFGVSVAKRESGGSISVDQLKKTILAHGIEKGDLLIVHSAMKNFRKSNISAEVLLDLLLDIIGSEGTLVMPAFPSYKESPKGPERLTKDLSDEVWTYNVQKTPSWTGLLPSLMMRHPGARRGRHPLNTVVAIGAEVEDLFSQELAIEGATPCGPESPWAYCAKNDAKMLFLDVDLAHSLTMIHVAEDCHESDWPIPNWYRDRKFKVNNNGVTSLVHVRERHPKWANFYAERKLSHDLFSRGIAKQSSIEHIKVASLGSRALLKFLESKMAVGYPYFLWKNAK